MQNQQILWGAVFLVCACDPATDGDDARLRAGQSDKSVPDSHGEPKGHGLGLQYDDPESEQDYLPIPECVDEDGDGVPNHEDCDDANPDIGALLYEHDFADEPGFMHVGAKLDDPWWFDGEAHNSAGGQQALLGDPIDWTNTVTFGRLRLDGVELPCGHDCPLDETRFRAGYLARVTHDADQDEGYTGYRCAVARNSGQDCYDPGPFVQLAAFLDGPEDDYNSECNGGCPPNPTFDQLVREERSEATNLLAGDSAELVFWVVGEHLVCEFYGEGGEHVVAETDDSEFDSGTTGLSVLNGLAAFDYIKVCEAFATP